MMVLGLANLGALNPKIQPD